MNSAQIQVTDIVGLWPSGKSWELAFFEASLYDLSQLFHAPIIRGVDQDAILLFDKRIGVFSIVPMKDTATDGWLYIIVDIAHQENPATRSVLRELVSAQYELFWTDEPYPRAE